LSRLKPSDAKILAETFVQACEPLSKEDLVPAVFASTMSYCEAMDWTLDESLHFIIETFGWLNKLKISGTPILPAFLARYRKTGSSK